MESVHPDDTIIEVVIVTAYESCLYNRTPVSKLHDLFVKFLDDEGWVEAITLPWGTMFMGENGKQKGKEPNWSATAILREERRIREDDFVTGDVLLTGNPDPNDEDGWTTSVNLKLLHERWPGIFA